MNTHAQFMADDAVVESAADYVPIPECLWPLANEPRWVLWQWETRENGKRTKRPYQTNGQLAKTNDPSTWATLTEAQAAYAAGGFDGIGLNLLGLKGIGAIDLDNVRDPATGAILYAWAEQVIRCGSYAEVTPSGTGFRVIGKTSLPATHSKGRHPEGGEAEIYANTETGRYITVTGQRVGNAPDELNSIDAVIAAMREAPQAQLPGDILRRIAANAAVGERSSAFQGVVNACVNRRLPIEQVESAMRAHPDGIANKYLIPADRLTKELKRSWDDATEKGYVSPHGAQPKKRRRFTLQRIGELEIKKPEYLIDGLIETGCLGLLFGDPGVGKSFLALEWALCVASGDPSLGKEVRQGPVVYIAGEGREGLVRRCYAWAVHNGADLDELPFHLSSGAADISDRNALHEVMETIREADSTPAMIVLDTLARNFGGGDENSTKDMTAFIAAVDELKEEFPGCVILIVHHSGHTEKNRARGSMALKGAMDFEYRLEAKKELPDAKETTMLLTNTKMKDGAPPKPITLELRQVDLGDKGTSAVVVPGAGQAEADESQSEALNTLISAALSHGKVDEQGLFVPTEAWRDAFYAAQGSKNPDAKRQAFNRACKKLVRDGRVVKNGEGFRVHSIIAMQVNMKRQVINV